MKPQVEYLPDKTVDNALDLEIRGLLTACFTKPEDVVFQDRRYFREPYPHRWVIREENNAIVAHIGVHDKEVETGDDRHRIGGIAEVCVHPDYRGKGYVRMMLTRIHSWLSEHGFVFTVLFGNPQVYASSGYVQVSNLIHGGGEEGWKPVKAMVRDLSETPWPGGDVRLRGPTF